LKPQPTHFLRLSALVLVVILIAGVLLGRRASTVSWQEYRAVIIESDDWGLCGFLPDCDALTDVVIEALDPGSFPEIYWSSTLEDSMDVTALCAVLQKHLGSDGLPAVIQANYILASVVLLPRTVGRIEGGEWLADQDEEWAWYSFQLPDLPSMYSRPGLWSAVHAGMAIGVWYPELHGLFHYDPEQRRRATELNDVALAAARRGVMVFPGSESAWENGEWRKAGELAAELRQMRSAFSDLFGQPPTSVIASDYVWDARAEHLWAQQGLRVIQAKREQRPTAYRGRGVVPRTRKVLTRAWDRLVHPERVYLERNCRLEAVQASEPEPVIKQCLADIATAWRRGEAAVVETHRVNYVHCDASVAQIGRQSLDLLLEGVSGLGEGSPLYLTDFELGQLDRRGVSWCIRGNRLVLRNLSHSRRIIQIPEAALARWTGQPMSSATAGESAPLVVLAPGESGVVVEWPNGGNWVSSGGD